MCSIVFMDESRAFSAVPVLPQPDIASLPCRGAGDGRAIDHFALSIAGLLGFLDGAVVEHFRALAGARGYQTLIIRALKQAMQAESIEAVVRQAIRDELRRG